MTTVLIRLGAVTIRAQLNGTATAAALVKALPITTTAHRWGDELYCAIPVVGVPESPTLDVNIGDLGFWLEGQSLCLFFGRTPASMDDRPRPIVPINVIGRFTLDERIRAVHDGVPMQITQANDERT